MTPPPVARIEETRTTLVLRALVHGLAAATFTYPLAQTQTVKIAALGSVLGVLSARYLARTALRSWTVGVFTVLALALASALGGVLASSPWLASSAGPTAALRISDDVAFGLGAFVLSAGVRALSLRKRVLAVFEVGFIALAFAQLLIAHRQGAINRPFELADPILAAGADPTIAILGVGGFAVAIILVLLLEEKSPLRNTLHLLSVLVFVVLVFSAARIVGVPSPPPSENGIGNRNGDTGQNGSPRPQSQPSNAPVAVVLLDDDYSPPTGTYYFRQAALSYFNGTRLIAANRQDVDRDLARSFPTAPMEVEHPAQGMDRTLVHTQVALMADHSRPFGLEAETSLRPLRNPNPSRFVRAYEVTSLSITSNYVALLGINAGSAAWSEDVHRYYTHGPADPRYAQLANTIVEALPPEFRQEPIAKVMAITEWLGREGMYSLRSHHASTEDFLFGDKIGYCVDFAHAAVTLMRAAGLPARVATGYQYPESARQGGSSIVLTDAFAHAWPEVYLEGVGWIVTDVSVERSLDPPPEPPDPDLQRLLGQMARGELPIPTGSNEGIPTLIARVKHGLQDLGFYAANAFAALLVLLYATKVWRMTVPRFANENVYGRVAYRACLDRLSASGLSRHWGESRGKFAERVAVLAPSFVSVTDEHLAGKFGGVSNRVRMQVAAKSFGRELSTHVPFWRRLLGAMHPVSFLSSR